MLIYFITFLLVSVSIRAVESGKKNRIPIQGFKSVIVTSAPIRINIINKISRQYNFFSHNNKYFKISTQYYMIIKYYMSTIYNII